MKNNRPLGDFLRARRNGLAPATLGLSQGRRRRTPGLRREEVAERAGISCEWYIKLEQGRDVAPSAETVEALARALALDPAQAAHLRKLAHGQAPSFSQEIVPDIICAIVKSLPDPAYVTGARWDILTWNAAADELFGFSRMAAAERNILLFMLTDPVAKGLLGEDWLPQARRMIALFRVSYDAYAGDPAFEAFVSLLTQRSPEFAACWLSHDISEPAAGFKILHPSVGLETSYAYASFQSNDNPALKLSLYKREANLLECGTVSEQAS